MIKPIETVYNGYRFRSRLEARWAVFFDALGVKYQYEPEGLDLGTFGWYLPDFYVPHLDTYFEIKPGPADHWPEHKAFDYITKGWDNNEFEQNFRFVLLAGDPWLDTSDMYTYEDDKVTLYDVHSADGFAYCGYIPGDCYYRWCECPDCGFIGIEFDGRSDRLACKCCYVCQDRLETKRELDTCIRDNIGTEAHLDCLKDRLALGCPRHGHNYSKEGCPRHGGNHDKGYNVATPRLIAAYTAARQARFEHGETPQVPK